MAQMTPASASLHSSAKPPSDNDARFLPLVPSNFSVIFILITILFFLWAIPNNLNVILIRQFMKSFAMTQFQAGLVQSSFYLGYFLLAMPAALIMRRFGYKSGFVIGLSLFSLGAVLFWPAAIVHRYAFFLFALFVIAAGLSFLETASNPFIAQLGDSRTAARRLNLAQAFNALGSISGTLIGTVFIFSGVDLAPHQAAALEAQHRYAAYLHTETMRVVAPYLMLGTVTFLMLVLIAVARFPASLHAAGDDATEPHHLGSLLRRPHFLMAVVAQFAYVGTQVGTWSYLIPYILAYTSEKEKAAGYFLTGSLVLFGVGRFVSAWLMRFVQPSRLMAIYAVINTVLVSIGVFFPGWIGMILLLCTSFFMSLMYPTIFAQGVRGLGDYAKVGGSILVMAIVGGAVLTPLMGLISVRFGSMALAYLVPAVAYVAVAFYSVTDLRAGASTA